MKVFANVPGPNRLFAALVIFSTATLQMLAQAPAMARATFAPAESEIAERITIASIKEMTAALSAPEMEGRGTGQLSNKSFTQKAPPEKVTELRERKQSSRAK